MHPVKGFSFFSPLGIRLLVCLLSLIGYHPLKAQDSCRLQVSLLTCGSGEDLYSCYGHSALRISDTCRGSDWVYNYGTFNFGDPDFYWKFTRGKLAYYLNVESFTGFMQNYAQEGRRVQEQVLDLTAADALAIQSFLQNNAKEENKYYRYDFLFDNCSTRLRDLFPRQFKQRFHFGHAMSNDSCSFREVLDFYERRIPATRLGINLLMSHRVDERMNNEQSMFLPDFLMGGMSDATLDGHFIVKQTRELLPDVQIMSSPTNWASYSAWLLLLSIVFLSLAKPGIRKYLLYFDVFFFMILGLLGCFMLFMWLGTEHEVCRYNRNLLWAFPLHLVFAFLLARDSPKVQPYARYASSLIVLSFFYSFFAEQNFPSEITPMLWLILFRLSKYSSRIQWSQVSQTFRYASSGRS